jgi:MCM N-terminal domain
MERVERVFITTTASGPPSTMNSEMDVDDPRSDFPEDLPLRSDAGTPRPPYDDPPAPRRRRGLDEQVEKVTDETGEMVRGAFLEFLETFDPCVVWANGRFTDELDGQSSAATPKSVSNFYFAQLEEIERFGLTTLYVDFKNLEEFTINGETGVLAQAISQQYYRYSDCFTR